MSSLVASVLRALVLATITVWLLGAFSWAILRRWLLGAFSWAILRRWLPGAFSWAILTGWLLGAFSWAIHGWLLGAFSWAIPGWLLGHQSCGILRPWVGALCILQSAVDSQLLGVRRVSAQGGTVRLPGTAIMEVCRSRQGAPQIYQHNAQNRATPFRLHCFTTGFMFVAGLHLKTWSRFLSSCLPTIHVQHACLLTINM